MNDFFALGFITNSKSLFGNPRTNGRNVTSFSFIVPDEVGAGVTGADDSADAGFTVSVSGTVSVSDAADVSDAAGASDAADVTADVTGADAFGTSADVSDPVPEKIFPICM
jgi:hypothetical protein